MDNKQPWDTSIKQLVRQNPQDLVSFLLAGAEFESEINPELKNISITADALYTVKWRGEAMVLHVEFQRNRHRQMGRRLWKYNALTNMQTDLPVHSVVIYLVEESSLASSPYVIPLPDGRATQRLDFDTIKLWEIPPEVFEQPGLVGLLPLLPLTRGGKNRETVDRMIDRLQEVGKDDLLVLGHAFSWLVFMEEGEDTEWLKARFFMQYDILKDTWVFQEIIKEGLEKGLEEGRKEGLGEGLLQFVEMRFPTLLPLAKQAIERQMSVQLLRTLFNRLYRANTIEEAGSVLRACE